MVIITHWICRFMCTSLQLSLFMTVSESPSPTSKLEIKQVCGWQFQYLSVAFVDTACGSHVAVLAVCSLPLLLSCPWKNCSTPPAHLFSSPPRCLSSSSSSYVHELPSTPLVYFKSLSFLLITQPRETYSFKSGCVCLSVCMQGMRMLCCMCF